MCKELLDIRPNLWKIYVWLCNYYFISHVHKWYKSNYYLFQRWWCQGLRQQLKIKGIFVYAKTHFSVICAGLFYFVSLLKGMFFIDKVLFSFMSTIHIENKIMSKSKRKQCIGDSCCQLLMCSQTH